MLGLRTNFYILLLLIFNLFAKLSAQVNTDSLKQVLNTTKEDSSKIKIFGQLFNALRESSPDEAEAFAVKGIKLAEKTKDKKSQARLCHNLGTFYYLKANYPVALNYSLIALGIREEMGDSVNLVKSLNNVGLIYYEENNFSEALKYHNKSIAIKLKLKDKPGLASSYGNIGNVYFRQANQKSSDSLYTICDGFHKKALVIQEEIAKNEPDNIQNLVGLSATYNNLGNVAFEKSILNPNDKLLSLSVEYHYKALDIQTKIGDERGIAHSYINIGGIHQRLKKTESAIACYEKALSYALKTDDKESIKACYDGLFDSYEKSGDCKKSLHYHKLLMSIKDSIWDESKTEQLAEMQTKYEADKKSKEIELLNKNQILHENELERQTLLRNSFIVGSILLVALVLILFNRYRIKSLSSKKLEEQNAIIGEKNKEILDSIKYAKRIQEAILPPQTYIDSLIPENFIYYKPKDIVSGDFYWVDNIGDKIYIAAVDCTGHGVPGAFISIVGFNLLKHAIHEHGKTIPSDILNQVNIDLSESLRQSFNDSTVKDGMDISLCCYDLKNATLQYAGANNSIYIVSKNENNEATFKEIKADKHPIGIFLGEDFKPFTNHTIKLNKGDVIYQFTDGFADQFGGPLGKKFKYRPFEELLLKNSQLPTSEQKNILSETHETWKGLNEQVDDILVLGVRI